MLLPLTSVFNLESSSSSSRQKILEKSQYSAFNKNHGVAKDHEWGKRRRRRISDTSISPAYPYEDFRSITLLPDTPLTIVFENEVDSNTPLRSLFEDESHHSSFSSSSSYLANDGRRRLIFSPISPAPSTYSIPNSREDIYGCYRKDHRIVVPMPVFKEIVPLATQRKNLYMRMKSRKTFTIVRRSERISDAIDDHDDE